MADAQINYKLDLIVRLVETTSGRMVSQRQVIFKSDGQIVPFLRRDEGVYVLLNHGRQDIVLDVSVLGYLPTSVEVKYEDLSEVFPEIEVPLIPESGTNGFVDMITLEGECLGLTSIEAVSLVKPHGGAAGYQERKQVLKLYNSKPMGESEYAILHGEREFEIFRIKKRLDKLSLKLVSPLTSGCKPEEKIVRIVKGKVDKNGRYLLRLLNEGNGTEYLVRYVVKGKVSFKKISADSPELTVTD